MKIKSCIFLSFYITGLLLFSCCDFKILNASDSYVAVNLSFNQSRSGIPDLPADDFSQYLWIFTVTNLESDVSSQFYSKDLQKTELGYILPITSGKWKITVKGYVTEADETIYEIFSSAEKNLSVYDSGYYSLTLNPMLITKQGYGQIDLKIQVDSSEITRLVIQNSNSLLDDSYEKENNIFSIKKENIPAGTYKILLCFCDEESQIFSYEETINIRSNCVTKMWTGSGVSENGFGKIQGNLLILDESLFANQTCFYVRGKNGLSADFEFCSENNRSVKEGTLLNPFQSLQDAVSKIMYLNEQSENQKDNKNIIYIIYVDGLISDKNHIFSEENNYAFINLISDTELKIKICGLNSASAIDAGCSSSKSGRIIYLGDKVQLFLENISLTGGYTSLDGAGIYVSAEKFENENEYNLNLCNNVTICSNHTEGSGGGIFIDQGNVKIEGKNTYICHNYAKSKGGGICITGLADKTSRNLEISGGSIYKNTSLSATGKNGVGGGLYTQFATVNLNQCNIEENTAANGGGIGIAQNSILRLNNTLISGNNAIYDKGKGGGGIFASGVSAKLYLQDGTNIQNNNSNSQTNKGGGITATTTELHIFNNVHIMNNTFNNSAESNLSSTFSKLLTIETDISDSIIGVTVAETALKNLPITFTKGFSNCNSTSLQSVFYSDNDNYSINKAESGELLIKANTETE